MESVISLLSIFAGLLVLFCIATLIMLLKSTGRIIETNKQLLILIAGQNGKVETMRALVASSKPPQGKLSGIANKKSKENKKPENTNYIMEIGIH